MLTVKTYVDKSSIQGLGLFAGEFIPKGALIWLFCGELDRFFSEESKFKLLKEEGEYLDKYAFFDKGSKLYVLCGDNARFTNHSNTPNTEIKENAVIATKDIQIGEEITEDYYLYDLEADKKLGLAL